jgi:hypothetical protein
MKVKTMNAEKKNKKNRMLEMPVSLAAFPQAL